MRKMAVAQKFQETLTFPWERLETRRSYYPRQYSQLTTSDGTFVGIPGYYALTKSVSTPL